MKKEIEESKTALVGTAPTAMISMVEEKPLIADERVLKLFEETLEGVKEDRAEAQEKYLLFCDMVINDGAHSNASIEAIANLLKIKNAALDQNIKVLDLWTRLKLKERVSPAQIHAFQQNNKYEVANTPSPQIRNLIKMATELDKVNDSD